MKKLKSHGALLLGGVALVVGPGFAAEQNTAQQLPAVTISDDRSPVDADLPAPTESVTADTLQHLNIPNSEDAVKYMPNLRVRKRFIGDRNAPIEVRGTSNIQGGRGLVLADGILLSNFLSSQHENAPRWSMVLPEEIERVDVIYGPYSALYSGNAMGAAVLFTTRMPDDFEATASLQAHQQQFNYLGTDDNYDGHVLNAFLGDRKGAFSYLLGLSRMEATSQPTQFVTRSISTTPAQPADTLISRGAYYAQSRNGVDTVLVGVGGGGIEDTEQDEFKLKLGYDFTPTLQGRLTVASWTMDREAGEAGNTTWLRDAGGNPVYSGNVNIDGMRYNIPATSFSPRAGEEEHWNYAASLKTNNQSGWDYEAVASLYDMAENLTRTSTTAPPGAFSGGNGTLSYLDGSGWKTFDAKAEQVAAEGNKHRWSFGYHFDLYELDQKNYSTADWRNGGPSGVTADTFAGQTTTQAVFVQDAWRFADRWKTVLGLRYEAWKAMDGLRSVTATAGVPAVTTTTTAAYPERSESNWSPKAALEFTPNQAWTYRLSLAQAYRFPTVTELFQGNISGNQIINSDPNLKPEHGFFKDFTVERHFDKATARLSIYEEDTKDILFRQTNTVVVPSVTNYQNIDHVRVRGIELVYDGREVFLPQLDLSASLAFNDSEILENGTNPATVGNDFYRIPRSRASLVAIYHQNDKLAYTLAGRYSGKQYGSLENTDVNPNAFDGVSDYTVFDAKLTYAVNSHVKLGVGVDNLTDERYFVGHPYAGRTLFGEVKLAL